jgi:hypothetical protein
MRSDCTPALRIAADSASSAKPGASSGPLAITPKKSRGTLAAAPAGRHRAATRTARGARRIGEA